MRIYEISRQYNVPAKEIIKILRDAGFEVSSHMSVLNPKAINFLKDKFEKKEASQEKTACEKEAAIEPDGIGTKEYDNQKKQAEPRDIILAPTMVMDVAQRIAVPVNELILTLLRWGIVATKNQVLSEDIIARLAEHYEVATVKPKRDEIKDFTEIAVEKGELRERLPVVVVLGHVDHGKTTLLDFIRKTRVTAKEKGGITQHLGAYEAQTPYGNIIFLDTPGHEAFSKMRGRGVRVADIAVLVVAADDGVMPQTIEAIKQMKAAHIPIIVAINKVDKASPAQIEAVKRSLAQHDLLPEEWGGDIICIPISAKFGNGIEHLLEMITLQAQMMELRADVAGHGLGYVLESKPQKGRGPIATILCKHGKIKVGDFFISGNTFGRVNSLVDASGKSVKKVGASIPVQVAGFSSLPEVGDLFKVVSRDEFRKEKSAIESHVRVAPKKLITEGAINLVIKTDSNSSKEALLEAIAKLSRKGEKEFNIIYAGVGGISESDVLLASDTGSIIFALHVKAEANANLLAQRYAVSIYLFDIIYKLLEALEELAKSKKEVKIIRIKTGEAIVRRVFSIKNIGVIAGCYVTEGLISREGSVIIWRKNKQIGAGKIKSLQRERKTVKEVHAGFECGFLIEGFEDWAVDDKVECFIDRAEDQK